MEEMFRPTQSRASLRSSYELRAAPARPVCDLFRRQQHSRHFFHLLNAYLFGAGHVVVQQSSEVVGFSRAQMENRNHGTLPSHEDARIRGVKNLYKSYPVHGVRHGPDEDGDGSPDQEEPELDQTAQTRVLKEEVQLVLRLSAYFKGLNGIISSGIHGTSELHKRILPLPPLRMRCPFDILKGNWG